MWALHSSSSPAQTRAERASGAACWQARCSTDASPLGQDGFGARAPDIDHVKPGPRWLAPTATSKTVTVAGEADSPGVAQMG
jgi:hypothetical protein